MTYRVVAHDKHPDTEVRCSDRCGWNSALNAFPLDSQGNFVLPMDCPECSDGFTYLPGGRVTGGGEA